MTAFAAIVQKEGQPAPVAAIARVLGSITGRPAASLALGPCTIVAAPLHCDDPPGPIALPSGAAVAGGVLLEAPRELAASLGERGTPSAAALTGAAYGRWGQRFTDRLSGEFAFALWDSKEQTLLCARDGLGLRLLYVAEGPRAIVVTNVLEAALQHPQISTEIDEAALIAFLAHGSAADHVRTSYRDIGVLPPGHTLAIDASRPSRTRMWRHWHFPVADGVRRTDAAILEAYRARLADAVRDRTDAHGTSIFLSGGLDSTTMAAAAKEVAPPGTLQAITTRYPRYIDDLERPFTRAAAEHLALPLTTVDAGTHDPWHVDPADSPPAAPIDEPMLGGWRDALACAAGHGTAALYGEDGDALLRPPGWQALRNAGSIPSIGVAAARYALSERRRPYLGLRWRERMGIVRPRADRVPGWLNADARAILDCRESRAILGCAVEPLPPHPTRPEAQAILTSTTISRHFAAMIAPETTRRRIELRLPILDTRLIALVMSIPAIPWCQHKTLPRRAYRGRLPPSVLARPKTPLFGFNEAFVAEWRRNDGRRAAARPASPVDAWIDAATWIETVQSGDPVSVMAAWRVTALDTWFAAQARSAKDAACTR
jgi:asparagine synthase (glutamine-hydrolysing)